MNLAGQRDVPDADGASIHLDRFVCKVVGRDEKLCVCFKLVANAEVDDSRFAEAEGILVIRKPGPEGPREAPEGELVCGAPHDAQGRALPRHACSPLSVELRCQGRVVDRGICEQQTGGN